MSIFVPLKESDDHRRWRGYSKGGYAHFPGTGPQGKTCRDCVFKNKTGSNWFCAKTKELLRGQQSRPIDLTTPACRHFSVKKDPA